MKKIEKVSIGKYAFTVEEDAFKVISDYLSDLQAIHPVEVIDCILERMAELFIDKCPGNAIVTYQIAIEVVGILGKPERYDGENPPNVEQPKKKLYRDVRDKIFGGVCSGLAAFFNLDIALMRVIWILAFFLLCIPNHAVSGTLVIAYLVLWICIPKADTVQKRYEMRGEKISVENIGGQFGAGVKSMSDEMKENSILKTGVRVIECIAGLILLSIGVCGIVAGCCYLVGMNLIHGFVGITDWMVAYFGIIPKLFVTILASLVYFIPMLGMLYAGVMMTFNLKSPRWKPGVILFILWLIAIIALICTTVFAIFAV